MTIIRKTELVVDHRFDPRSCRHFLGDVPYVLHCHHYATLYCQLADDAEMFDGKALLRKSAELSFYDELNRIFTKHCADKLEDKVALAEEYWQFVGMGLLDLEAVGPMAGSATMAHSHVDEGWIKKWGKRDEPVNFIGQGYLQAVWSALFELPPGSFNVHELESIVAGADCSRFSIVRA